MGRNRKIVTAIAQPGSGKSTVLEEIFLHRHKKYEEPFAILDFNNQKRWLKYPMIDLDRFKRMVKGIYRVNAEGDWRAFFSIARECYREGMILAEDAFYLPEKKEDEIYPCLIGLRHNDVDMGFTTHSVKDTPKFLMRQSNEILLGKTGDVWKDIADRIRDDKRELFREKFEQVNASSDQYEILRIVLNQTGKK